jgi:Rieske Fe-S protein
MDPSVTRRGLLAGAVVTVAAGIAGYAVATNSSAAHGRRSTTAANNYGFHGSSGRRLLASLASLPIGGGRVLGKDDVVLTRDDSGVHAFSATCTHQGCTVTQVSDGRIRCPCHGSQFDARTGAPVVGPATRPLPPVPITVEGDSVFTG